MVFGFCEVVVALTMLLLLLLDIYCVIKLHFFARLMCRLSMSSGVYVGTPAVCRYLFCFGLSSSSPSFLSVVRCIHFLLLNGLEYKDKVIGLMPFYNYSYLYLLCVDELSNFLFFVTIFQYSLTWYFLQPRF